MPYPGVPELPYFITWSGDLLVYVMDVPVIRNGIPHKRVYLIPTPKVMARYNLDPDKLDYTVTEYGTLTREYPMDAFHWLAQNPDNQLVLSTMNFDGTSTIGHKILEQSKKITRLIDIIQNLENENQEIRNKLRIAIERLKMLGAKSQ